MFSRLGTHARIALLILAASLPTLAGSLYVASEQRRAAEAHAFADLEVRMQLAAAFLGAQDLDGLATRGLAHAQEGEFLTVLDPQGRVLAQYGFPLPGEKSAPDAEVVRELAHAGGALPARAAFSRESRLYHVGTVPAAARTQGRFMVVASISEFAVHESSDRARLQMVTGIGTLGVALIVATWFGAERYVMRPIRALLQMTQRVRDGDFSARSELTATHDELSQLGAALDHMAEQLQARDADLHKAVEALHTQAVTDSLTGMYNRRFFQDALTREAMAARRKRTTFSVILLDIDHFKKVNDTWGHQAGDHVLVEIARVIRESVRGSDIPVRHGGEEFALVLPGATDEVAGERAESLRQAVESMVIDHEGSAIRISASFGVAEYKDCEDGITVLMKAVDEAMYSAKESGRNRVVISHAQPRAVA